jgi:large subunit ribosomal protein L18
MATISATRRIGRARRHFRVRKKVAGTPLRPRLVINRSARKKY